MTTEDGGAATAEGDGPADGGHHIKVPWAQQPDYRCFGCSPHNPSGLQLRFEPYEGDALRTELCLTRAHESYPGVVHGGVVSTVCDETMGNLVVLRHGMPAFTVSQRMRYFKPLAVGSPYHCVVRLRDGEDGKVVQAVAEVLDADGELMASSAASYRCVPMDRAREHLQLDDENARELTHRLQQHSADH